MDVEERGKMMMLRRKTNPKTGKHTWCEPAQSKRTWTFPKSHCVLKFTGKMAGDSSGDGVLCEPAQSKRTWTFHKSDFDRFCMEIYRKNAGHPGDHLDQTPGLYCYHKNPFSVATLFREKPKNLETINEDPTDLCLKSAPC